MRLPAVRPTPGSDSSAVALIGTLNERSLHAQLKSLYLEPNSTSEVVVDGFVVDILHPNGEVVEIQTRHLYRLKGKLAALLASRKVVLVYPLPVEKQLIVIDARRGNELYRRMSPRRPALPDAFAELTGISPLLASPNLELHVLLIREQEIRRADGRGSWRRKGLTIVDRRLVEIRQRCCFPGPAHYLSVLPESCPTHFTNRELAALMGIPSRTAGRLTYCLRGAGVLAMKDKRGREYLYSRLG
jgi:hypothetical protein